MFSPRHYLNFAVCKLVFLEREKVEGPPTHGRLTRQNVKKSVSLHVSSLKYVHTRVRSNTKYCDVAQVENIHLAFTFCLYFLLQRIPLDINTIAKVSTIISFSK